MINFAVSFTKVGFEFFTRKYSNWKIRCKYSVKDY